MLTKNDITIVIELIVARLRPQQVILFGSYAKGTATLKSDLDLFVIQETVLPFTRRAEAVMPLFATLPIRVDIHIYTPEEVESYRQERFSFVSSVLASGETLFLASSQPP